MNGLQYVIAVSESLDFHMDTVFCFWTWWVYEIIKSIHFAAFKRKGSLLLSFQVSVTLQEEGDQIQSYFGKI